MKVLVKVKGRKKNSTATHVYNEETDSALYRPWPKPGEQWEVQEVESFEDVRYGLQCWHCQAKLKPKPPKAPNLPPPRERRRLADLEKLAAWNEQAAMAIWQIPPMRGKPGGAENFDRVGWQRLATSQGGDF